MKRKLPWLHRDRQQPNLSQFRRKFNKKVRRMGKLVEMLRNKKRFRVTSMKTTTRNENFKELSKIKRNSNKNTSWRCVVRNSS
jgi:hypothetical protein